MRRGSCAALLLIAGVAAAEPDPSTLRLWKAKCAACHGADGKAETPQGAKMAVRSMASAGWQREMSADKIRGATRDGLKRTRDGKAQEMAAYKDKLTPEQIDSLVALIRTFGPAVAAPVEKKPTPPAQIAQPAPETTKPEDTGVGAASAPAAEPIKAAAPSKEQAAADRLWNKRCASCHGQDGKGQTTRGKKLAVTDLTVEAWQKDHSDEKIAETLRARELDRCVKRMAHFSGQLKPADVEALVVRIRELGGK